MDKNKIPFNWPHLTGKEIEYISSAHKNGKLAGDGPFTERCHKWLQELTGSKSLLTHSCTASLEMTALLMKIKLGDEVIMPSYTFVSTANAFVLRGAVPVFVDIREDTLNIDENLIESAITPRTRAIIAVHYAGVACNMDSIISIANKYQLFVVEDAAQGVMATYKDRPLGSIGDFGAYSFHETKNIICGEGGALIINNQNYSKNAEIIREKGTDRTQFFRGEVDKYTWQQIGSSFLPGEMTAAFLYAQLEDAEKITATRIKAWQTYHDLLEPFEALGYLKRPTIPPECKHNGHLYYVLLPVERKRHETIEKLNGEGINAVFHYVPLHSSPAGISYGRVHGDLRVTDYQAKRLLRLPLWVGINLAQQSKVVDLLISSL